MAAQQLSSSDFVILWYLFKTEFNFVAIIILISDTYYVDIVYFYKYFFSMPYFVLFVLLNAHLCVCDFMKIFSFNFAFDFLALGRSVQNL